MKRIEEMTKEEILALTSEKIDRIIDYVCAERGIPLLPPVPVEYEPFDYKKYLDTTVYELGGFIFTDKEEVDKVYDVLSGCHLIDISYVSGPRYEHRYNGDTNVPYPTVRKIYGKGTWDKIKDMVEEDTKFQKEYKEAKDHYNDVHGQRKEVVDEIMEVINDTQREQRNLEMYTNEFDRYLVLAEGDRNIAINFFNKAYPGILGKYRIIAEYDVPECDCSDE